MPKKIRFAALALVLAGGCAFNAAAQVKPETLVDQRIAAMRLQGKYFFPLYAMAQGRAPYDATIVARNAGYLDVLIKLAWDGFEPRTQDVKSRALPAIYGEPAKFKAAQDTMFAAMDKLVAAAKSGNEANVKVAVIDAGDACNNCHDTFRAKQQ
jgi:cytochrome c556